MENTLGSPFIAYHDNNNNIHLFKIIFNITLCLGSVMSSSGQLCTFIVSACLDEKIWIKNIYMYCVSTVNYLILLAKVISVMKFIYKTF